MNTIIATQAQPANTGLAVMDTVVEGLSKSLSRIAQEREVMAECYRKVFQAKDTLEAFELYRLPQVSVSTSYSNKRGNLEQVLGALDAEAWRRALYEAGFSAILNHRQLTELQEQFKRECPPATEANMIATFSVHLRETLATFIDGAIDTFRSLDAAYVTNDAFALKKKIILRGLGSKDGMVTWSSFGGDANHLNDLYRILMVLSNQNPLTMSAEDQPSWILERAKINGEQVVDLEHVTCSLFKNGNVHLVIKDERKVERVNELISLRFDKTLGYRKKSA